MWCGSFCCCRRLLQLEGGGSCWRTIDTVIDAHRVEGDAANGTGVCLLSPGSDAGIMDNMIATVQGGHDVEITRIVPDGLWDDGGVGRRLLLARPIHGGAAQGIQAYDALIRLGHDAGCGAARAKVMETCKWID